MSYALLNSFIWNSIPSSCRHCYQYRIMPTPEHDEHEHSINAVWNMRWMSVCKQWEVIFLHKSSINFALGWAEFSHEKCHMLVRFKFMWGLLFIIRVLTILVLSNTHRNFVNCFYLQLRSIQPSSGSSNWQDKRNLTKVVRERNKSKQIMVFFGINGHVTIVLLLEVRCIVKSIEPFVCQVYWQKYGKRIKQGRCGQIKCIFS